MKAETKHYKVTLTPITPIHIGSGEILDPYEYIVISEQSDGEKYNILYRLNLSELIDVISESERQELSRVMDGTNLRLQQKIIRLLAQKYIKSHPQIGIRLADVSDDFAKSYTETLGNPSKESKLEIHLMIRDQDTQSPYVPGSSLKGSLRTAWLNYIAKSKDKQTLMNIFTKSLELKFTPNPQRTVTPRRRQDKLLEAMLLENIHQNRNKNLKIDIPKDPFRALQITDLKLKDTDSLLNVIARMEILKTSTNNKYPMKPLNNPTQKIQLYYDVLIPYENKTILTGRIAIHEHLWRCKIRDPKSGKQEKVITGQPFNIPKLLRATNEFYYQELQDEDQKYYSKHAEWETQEIINTLKNHFSNINPETEAIIRIGRFSQHEYLTIAPLRQYIKKEYGKSRTLAKSTDWFGCTHTPLGWCKIKLEQI